jgi:hypothetical protein
LRSRNRAQVPVPAARGKDVPCTHSCIGVEVPCSAARGRGHLRSSYRVEVPVSAARGGGALPGTGLRYRSRCPGSSASHNRIPCRGRWRRWGSRLPQPRESGSSPAHHQALPKQKYGLFKRNQPIKKELSDCRLWEGNSTIGLSIIGKTINDQFWPTY